MSVKQMANIRVNTSLSLPTIWSAVACLACDFWLEDVWALPTPGGPDDFPRLVQLLALADPSQGSLCLVGTLWTIRWKVGELLG